MRCNWKDSISQIQDYLASWTIRFLVTTYGLWQSMAHMCGYEPDHPEFSMDSAYFSHKFNKVRINYKFGIRGRLPEPGVIFFAECLI